MEKKYLQVTIDKSHLITIGEKMYAESIELIRELVNNAYDADAENVRITINSEKIIIDDDGLGMDMKGLEQYFNIGSNEKKIKSTSSKFKRRRIGEFGIGKFATLSAAECFEVITKRGNFSASVIFDKNEWEKDPDRWHLPLELLSEETIEKNGTAVILTRLNKKFDLEEVERRLRESVPLKAPHFKVFINGKVLYPKLLQGRRIPFFEGTDYGVVHGEIVILPASQASAHDLGIEIKIKGVTVKRELFNMVTWGKDAARIKGEIHADFLPITSDRSNFILDSPEYKAFLKVVQRVIEDIRGALGRLFIKSENRKAKKAMKEAMHRVQGALTRHPDLSPFGVFPQGFDGKGPGGGPGEIKPEDSENKKSEEIKPPKKEPKKKRKKGSKIKDLTPNAVVQKIRFGQKGIACCIDNFGADGPESFVEGDIIFINRDHPLYIRELRKSDAHVMHISRLLTQEIALLKLPRNPRQAFENQSILLRDAFTG